jgi:glycosyltransferase involved in cell wall biosynthesis
VDVLLGAWRTGRLGEVADLVIVGDGPERARLVSAATDDASVMFVQRVSEHDLALLYRSCDVFVLPSVSGEGFGLAAAEALASGVPVVATDGAAAELVKDGCNGRVVPTGGEGALASALHHLLVDSALRASMAGAARRTRPQLSWDRSVHQLEDVIASCRRPRPLGRPS